MTLTFRESTLLVVKNAWWFGFVWMVSQAEFKWVGFGWHNVQVVSSRWEHIRRHIKSIYGIIADVRLDALVRWVSARFLHSKDTFPLTCWVITLKLFDYLDLQNHPLNVFSPIDYPCLKQWFTLVFEKWRLSNSSILSTLSSWHTSVK